MYRGEFYDTCEMFFESRPESIGRPGVAGCGSHPRPAERQWTDRRVDPTTELDVAAIVELPKPALLASPVLLTTATVAFDEVQATALVMSWLVLSEKAPVATNCWLEPRVMEGFVGVTVIETKVAPVTVRTVEPLTEPIDAAIVALPVA